MDYEKLVASEIWTTIQNLLIHISSKVQDKARALFESWKTKRDSNASISDVDKPGAFIVNEAGKSPDIQRESRSSESSLGDASISQETSVNTKGHELTRDDPVLSTSSDAVHPDQVESANNLEKILNPPIGDERPLDHDSSPSLPKPTMEPLLRHSVGATFEPCSQLFLCKIPLTLTQSFITLNHLIIRSSP